MPALNRRSRFAAAALLVLLVILVLPLHLLPRPAPRYTITDLGVLPGDSKSGAYAINNQGAVCGYSQALSKQACVFQNGSATRCGFVPSSMESIGRDINSHGAVTGEFGVSLAKQAFVYSNGRMQLLGTLPGFTGSEGVAINTGGEVAGRVTNFSLPVKSSYQHAFIYSHGRMTDLGALFAGGESEARSINSAGVVAGDSYPAAGRVRFVPFLYDSHRKTVTLLAMPPPYLYGYVNHLNDQGQAVGSVSAGGVIQAALWSGGHLTVLGSPPGYDDASAESINNRGEAVGRCFQEDNVIHTFLQRHAGSGNSWQRYLERNDTEAFVYQNGKMQDLSTLIPAGSGWTLEAAHSINDRGQIVGKGLHFGQERAFLLTPH